MVEDEAVAVVEGEDGVGTGVDMETTKVETTNKVETTKVLAPRVMFYPPRAKRRSNLDIFKCFDFRAYSKCLLHYLNDRKWRLFKLGPRWWAWIRKLPR